MNVHTLCAVFAHHSLAFCFSLTKNYRERPKYRDLLKHPFMRKYETADVNVAEWYARAKEQCEVNLSCSSPIRR
jgi:mitogen-activated protein kinase kinase 7